MTSFSARSHKMGSLARILNLFDSGEQQYTSKYFLYYVVLEVLRNKHVSTRTTVRSSNITSIIIIFVKFRRQQFGTFLSPPERPNSKYVRISTRKVESTTVQVSVGRMFPFLRFVEAIE